MQDDVESELKIEHLEPNGIMRIWIDEVPLSLEKDGEVTDFIGTHEEL